MKIQQLSNKFLDFIADNYRGNKFLIEVRNNNSILSVIPLINLIFDTDVFTYVYEWSFSKKSADYIRMQEKISPNLVKLKHPIYNFTYWMHSDTLYKSLEKNLINNCCIILTRRIDMRSRSRFKPSYFLSLFENPLLDQQIKIFIFDEIEYQPRQCHRPLEEEHYWDGVLNYDDDIFDPFKEFFRDNYLYNFILNDSKNIYLQFISLYLSWTTNQYIDTTKELIYSCLSNPAHPLWKLFSYFFDYMKEPLKYVPYRKSELNNLSQIFRKNLGETKTFWIKFLTELINNIYFDLEDNLNYIMFKKFQKRNDYDCILENNLKKIDSEKIKKMMRLICL
ncbi:MAG: hypothetical protein ACTSPD_18690 [Promethearchaeota archaeon]